MQKTSSIVRIFGFHIQEYLQEKGKDHDNKEIENEGSLVEKGGKRSKKLDKDAKKKEKQETIKEKAIEAFSFFKKNSASIEICDPSKNYLGRIYFIRLPYSHHLE